MALDRLAELNEGTLPELNNNRRMVELEPLENNKSARDEEAPQSVEDPQNMKLFWIRVKGCQKGLQAVKHHIERQEEIRIEYKNCINSNKEKELIDNFEQLSGENNTILKENKATLKQLEEDYKVSVREFSEEPETRMKEAQVLSLTTQLNEILREAQTVSINFKQSVKEKLKRQLKNVQDGPDAMNDEQIDELVSKDPEALNKMMQQKLFGKAHMKLEYAVKDIEEKCKGIEALHRNVRSLYEMMVEINEIVHAQGQQIDLIYNNVLKSKDYVEKGNKNLTKAKEYHQSARKKQCCIIMIAIAILVAIVLPLVLTIVK